MIYWVLMVLAFFKALRHAYNWWLNSTPPLRKLGPLVEGYAMFFARFLTSEGVAHRNQFGKWFAIFLGMVVGWIAALGLL